MKYVPTYIILNSKSHIMRGLFYFETTSISNRDEFAQIIPWHFATKRHHTALLPPHICRSINVTYIPCHVHWLGFWWRVFTPKSWGWHVMYRQPSLPNNTNMYVLFIIFWFWTSGRLEIIANDFNFTKLPSIWSNPS